MGSWERMTTRTLTLRRLDNVLDGLSLRLIEQRKRFDGCKDQVTTIYKENSGSLDEKKRELENKLKDNLPNLSEKLKDDIDYRIQTQRRRMEDKLKSFQEDMDELERQRDEVHADLTEETERIRKLNPELDQKEEALKEEKGKMVIEAKPLRQEVRRLSDVFLGRWKNRGRIRELEYQIENLQREIDDLTVEIDDVRKMWQEKKEEWRREKVTAEQRWNEITLRIAEIRHEYVYNRTNQETIIVGEGILRFVEELMDGTHVKAEDYSDELIKIHFPEISRLLERKKMLEGSLDVLTKFIGKLIGIDRGIKRLRKSVDALKDEQDRYASLRELQIETPQTVSEFEKLLGTLEAIPRKAADEHEDLRKNLVPFLDEDKGQLSDENIKQFFDSIADNLQAAVQTYWR
ncbi:MAG: hypothetical protein ACETWE_11165 [Candidatus Bathyarchaeia archaeon]